MSWVQHIINWWTQNSVYTSCIWVAVFTATWLLYRFWYKKKEREKFSVFAWWLITASGIGFGTYVAHASGGLKIGEVELPPLLIAPVYAIVTLVIFKVFISVVSMSLEDGLLPDSLKKVDPAKQEKLLLESYESDELLNNVFVLFQSEQSRNDLRLIRLHFTDDHDFAYRALLSVAGTLENAFGDTADIFFTETGDFTDPIYRNVSENILAVVANAIQKGNDYWSDKEMKQSASAVRVPYCGSDFVITVHFKDRIINPHDFQLFWKTVLAILNEPTVQHRGLAMQFVKNVSSLVP